MWCLPRAGCHQAGVPHETPPFLSPLTLWLDVCFHVVISAGANFGPLPGGSGGEWVGRRGRVAEPLCGQHGGGEWLTYSVVVTEAGRYDVSLAAASLTSSQVRIVVNGVDVTGALTLPATGGATHFVEVAAAARLQLSAGTHQIRLFIITAGANLDYLLLTPSATPTLYLPFMVKP